MVADEKKLKAAEATTAAESDAPQAPDGGWAWVIAAAVAVIHIVLIGPASSFPFLFADYLEELGQGTEGMTTVMSISMACASISGVLCNKLFQRFSCRQIGLMGASIFLIGQAPMVFVSQFLHFILSSITAGIGIGLIMPAMFTIFNTYFNRRRTFAMGLTQLVIGLGIFGFPMLAQKLVAEFGFRVTQGIFCGVFSLTFPAVAVFRPLKNEVKGDSTGVETTTKYAVTSQNSENKNASDVKLDHIDEKNDKTLANQEEKANIVPEQKVSNQESEDEEEHNLKERERHKLLVSEDNLKIQNNLTNKMHQTRLSVTSIASYTPPFVGAAAPPNKSKSLKSWGLLVVDLLDMGMLKDTRISSTIVAVSMTFFVDILFMTLLPLYLFSIKISHSDTALCMSIMNLADLAGRLSMALVGACCIPNNTLLFVSGATSAVLFRTLYIFFHDLTSLIVLTSFLGFAKCYLMVPVALVIADVCGMERFPAAFGLQSIITGLCHLIFGPFIGKLRDMTGSFTVCISTVGVMGFVCLLPLIIDLIISAVRKRTKEPSAPLKQ